VALVLAAASAASAADTRNVTAIKIRRDYTFRPVEKSFGIRDYTFFPSMDAKDLTFRVYKSDYTAVDTFFRDRFDVNGLAGDYKDFTSEIESARDMKLYNFTTDFWVPQRFRAFANSIEYAFGVASREAGYTFNVTGKKLDQFFYTYFTNNVTWNVENAFTAFKTQFGMTDDQITFATFRDFIFVPGFVRYVANSYVAGVKAVEVERE
jgi:hypothetical protein